MSNAATIEEAFVAVFVAKAKRERWATGLVDSRLRRKLLERLWNAGSDWDSRHVTTLRLTGKRPEQITSLIGELRRRGAGDAVHVLSTDEHLDGQTMSLNQAVDEISDDGGAVLICGPNLALHFPESGDPLLLAR
ncbi:MAG: hypothetical protein JO079_08855 [Frankiaceae bacterium]|nr:hypothetical protein [Frankiaceae bacterium]MBV9369620.1 hypothetical protein [Frankiales bacterium]